MLAAAALSRLLRFLIYYFLITPPLDAAAAFAALRCFDAACFRCFLMMLILPSDYRRLINSHRHAMIFAAAFHIILPLSPLMLFSDL